MVSQEALKEAAAKRAIDFIEPDMVVGVGAGTTVDYFISELAKIKGRIDGAVASSLATKKKLQALSIPVFDLNAVGGIPIYIDGADEINQHKQAIKGGGGALTGEKIIASAAQKWVCIVDASKRVDLLGHFPVAIEVIPMARSLVGRRLVELGADPAYRQGFLSDYGNVIIDAYFGDIVDPVELEETLTALPGVVSCGVFAKRPADTVIIASESGIIIE